jgi:hypothetical protein
MVDTTGVINNSMAFKHIDYIDVKTPLRGPFTADIVEYDPVAGTKPTFD